MEKLIEEARRGDAQAFERLVRLFQDRVFAITLSELGNYHQAQDAMQETFVEAYLRLDQLQTPAAFPVWLQKIARRKCVRVLRSGKSVVAPVPLESLQDMASHARGPEYLTLQRHARDLLSQALLHLSVQEREAFLLQAIGGYRYSEIGELLEFPLSLVKKRIYTARQKLRESESLATLRPSQQPGCEARLTRQAQERKERNRNQQMQEEIQRPQVVSLVGPGIEYKTVIKNLYVYYRYELLLDNHYPVGLTPPEGVTEDTWGYGAWVNQSGVINGLHSTTHDESVQGEDLFWERSNLQAYLIQLNGWPAGLALVASPPNATRGVDYRLQEFFVLNKARRRGVGTTAARLLFDRLPGKWELAYTPSNLAASRFWRKLIPDYTQNDFTEEQIGMGDIPDMPGYVFTRGTRPTHPIRVR